MPAAERSRRSKIWLHDGGGDGTGRGRREDFALAVPTGDGRDMKLVLVNPNTTDSMTRKMLEAARAVASADTSVCGVSAEYGPESIEGYYDEAFSIPATLDALRAHPDADGFVIGCFDDTGVDAARSVTAAPVIGICQAAMQFASVVSGSFTVVTTLDRSVPAIERLASRYGYGEMCRRVRASGIAVLELEHGGGKAEQRLREILLRSLDEDGCEAIVLGCAGMVEMARRFSGELGVPVIEGVTAAVKIVEGLAVLGIPTSKRGGYASPRAKAYTGLFARYAPGWRDGSIPEDGLR